MTLLNGLHVCHSQFTPMVHVFSGLLQAGNP